MKIDKKPTVYNKSECITKEKYLKYRNLDGFDINHFKQKLF